MDAELPVPTETPDISPLQDMSFQTPDLMEVLVNRVEILIYLLLFLSCLAVYQLLRGRK